MYASLYKLPLLSTHCLSVNSIFAKFALASPVLAACSLFITIYTEATANLVWAACLFG